MRRLLVWGLLVGTSACLTRNAPPKLAKVTPVAVAFVVDDEHSGEISPVPEAFTREVGAVLAKQNLELRPISFESFVQATQGRRDTQARFRQLQKMGGDAQFHLLIETNVAFFSQLSGKYRWDVSAKATASRIGVEGEPVENEVNLPALLQYDHERVPEALEYTAPQIAERVASLFAGLIGQNNTVVGAVRGDALYFVMVDRFSNGNFKNDGPAKPADPAAFHGGDLQGVIDRLDWLQQLGVGTVWLSPVFKMRTTPFFGFGAFHGYWTEDLTQIEPRFGDARLLAQLSSALRQRGMKLILDLVLNHVAMDSAMTRTKPEWFHRKGALENWNNEEELTTRDVHGLPDLSQERPEVYAYLSESAERWARELKLDGFRLDAVKHVPLSFWAKFNQQERAKFGPQFLLLGEMLDGDPKVLSRTQRDGAFGAMFDFPLAYALLDVFCRDQSPIKLGAVFSSDRLYPDPESLVPLIDNHDLPRVMSTCRGDTQRVKDALTVLLTARGTPALQYGTEVGLAGEKEPENRGDMVFEATHPLKKHIEQMMALRSQPALRHGAVRILRADEEVFAYLRVAPEQSALIVVNRGKPRVDLRTTLGTSSVATQNADTAWTDAFTGDPLDQVAGQSVRVAFGPPLRDVAASLAQWLRGEKKRLIEFSSKGVPLARGERAFIAGSGPELGAWNPREALGPLDSSGRVNTALPVRGAFEYKLVVQKPDGSSTWEEGANRALFVADAEGPVAVQLAWGRGSR
ncbi:MAG: alpha-amylase family glycosyl hydrolase [Myxococcaceae bacterium]